MTTYYTVTAVPSAHSFGSSSYLRAEYTLIQTGFATVNSEMVLKAPIASPTFTGTPAGPTPGSNISTTQFATTAWTNAYYAPIASPTFTGTVTVPTPSNSTDAVTKAYADGLSFATALPAQTGNSGKFVTTDGTTASWATTTISKSYTSSNQAITAAGSFTLAHGLGATPTLIRCFLVCLNTSLGYTAGQYIPINSSTHVASNGIALAADATNIYGIISTGGLANCALDLSTGVAATPNNTNFRLVVRAWL